MNDTLTVEVKVNGRKEQWPAYWSERVHSWSIGSYVSNAFTTYQVKVPQPRKGWKIIYESDDTYSAIPEQNSA